MPQMWVWQAAFSRWVWSQATCQCLPTQYDCFHCEGQACYHTICFHKSMLGQPLTLTAETMPVWILIYTAWCVRAQTLKNTLLIKTLYLFTVEKSDVLGKTSPEDQKISLGWGFCSLRPEDSLEGRGGFISQCMRADLRQNTTILPDLVGN